MGPIPVALAHDYLTQRGGAERVALAMTGAFPQAPLYTTLYEPDATFSEFSDVDVRVSWLNAVRPLRRRHRLALPLLASAASRTTIDAEVALMSSSGWAHGMPVTGRKIIYCHAPARWLYQQDRYLGAHQRPGSGRSGWTGPASAALKILGSPLRRWDQRAAAGADRYLANGTVTRDALRRVYGIDADILAPPPALTVSGPAEPVVGLAAGYLLCVSRLLPYKNVDVLIDAVARMGDQRLVVVGKGPDQRRLAGLAAQAPDRIRLLGGVSDAVLRWLYAHSSALVAASFEDFGLSPLEAAAFGRPAVTLRAGGYLDTVVEGSTGVFFDSVEPGAIVDALLELGRTSFDEAVLTAHAEAFSVNRFQRHLQALVATE